MSTNNESIIYQSNGLKKNLVIFMLKHNLQSFSQKIEKCIFSEKENFFRLLLDFCKNKETAFFKRNWLKEKLSTSINCIVHHFGKNLLIDKKQTFDKFKELKLARKIDELLNQLKEKDNKIEELNKIIGHTNNFMINFKAKMKELEEYQTQFLTLSNKFHCKEFVIENIQLSQTSQMRDESIKSLISSFKNLNENCFNLNNTNSSNVITKNEQISPKMKTLSSQNYHSVFPPKMLGLDLSSSSVSKALTTQTLQNTSYLSFTSRRNLGQNMFFIKSKNYL
jgi:hypothetical protein